MNPFEIDDLPKYSHWVSELLSDKNTRRLKNPQQIIREYGVEKWGSLLEKWKKNHCGVEVVRGWECSPLSKHAGLIDGRLMLMTTTEAHAYYVNLIEHALLEDPARHLVEIGCGYGSVLFGLVERGNIKYDSIMGIEFTEQGVELAQNLARWHKYEVTIGQGDFNSPGLSDLGILPDCDIITSFALPYARDAALILRHIIELKPRRVLHFEPIFQHYREHTVLGLLQKRYMEVNDYNSKIRQEVTKLLMEKKIEMIQESPLIFGINCLLPASLLIWRPHR